MPGLSFSEVRKNYDEVPALRGIDLEVVDGELLVLVGPSGSGKTTALRLAAGLEQVTAGTIRIGDRDVTRLTPGKRNVSMVFQSYALFPHLTVAENIAFGLRARGTRGQEAARRVDAAAELAGCDGLLARKPFQLSGGERQRVALARALVREPDVFLLDEPLSNLDAHLRVRTRAELKRLHQRLQTTMVYVTHDQVEALTLGDRVAVLAAGELQQVDSPEAIYRRPSNRTVASFIGTPAMNLLPAAIGDGALHAGPFRLDSAGLPPELQARQLELGVRPEHVRVAAAGAGLPARVDLVETAGEQTYLHLASAGATIVASVGAGVELEPDAIVGVSVSPAHAYLFDAESGERLMGG